MTTVGAREIVDVHAHIGRTVSSGIGQTTDGWLRTMDRVGIEASVLSVAAGGEQSQGLDDTRRANDVLAAARRDHPDRFIAALGSVEVRHGEPGLVEVARVMDELGFAGLAFHATFEGFSVDSAAFDAVLAAMGDREAVILLHSTSDAKASPAAIAQVAQRYPRLRFVLGHPVFTPAQREDAIEQLRANANLWLDIAYQDSPKTTTDFVQALGADRVLFGSDAPFFEPERVIASVESAEVSDDQRDAIFAGNTRRLFSGLHQV